MSKAEGKKIAEVTGAGKTYVLAKRAVNEYVRTRRPVLVLTYNITLKNYIHDRISEVRETFDWEANVLARLSNQSPYGVHGSWRSTSLTKKPLCLVGH